MKIIVTVFLLLSSNLIFADEELLTKKECEETKNGIKEMLGIADYHFKETDNNNSLIQSEEQRKKNEEELLGGAIAFSQIAANYSIIYDVWCKD